MKHAVHTWCFTALALWTLTVFVVRKRIGGFAAIRSWIDASEVLGEDASHDVIRRAVRAVDVACGYFPRDVRCLGRAATLTRLLRRHGVAAHFVIGTRMQPFAAHAWVECCGLILGQLEEHRRYVEIDRLPARAKR